MLSELVNAKMKQKNLSLRKAAKQIGVSHTTISRVVKGNEVDLDTVVAIANWLEISPNIIMGMKGDQEATLSLKITSMLEIEPNLKDVLEETVSRIERGEASSQLIQDIVAYAKFKLDMEQMRNKGKLSGDAKQK